MTAKRLTTIPAQLPAGVLFTATEPKPGSVVFRYDPAQAPRLTPADRAADLATLARIEAEIGAAR